MRRAEVYQTDKLAGHLTETDAKTYRFDYLPDYRGRPISLTLPVRLNPYLFDAFPSFFEGLLPEGRQLEALLRTDKLDRNDLMGQLLAVGEDVVGSVQIFEAREPSPGKPEPIGPEQT
jgi:serine/threonine-protein kinase HipA